MHSKIIHYCWFGGSLPEHQKEYIEGWRAAFPDYEIKHWHEDNIPSDDVYVERVLAAKKWAFLADHVRLYALYNYGGIYFDTDIKVIKNFEDELTNEVECLFGFETDASSNKHYVGTAVIAAQKKSSFIKSFLNQYDNRLGRMMARNDRVTGPKVLTPLLEQKGLSSSETQNLGNIRILQRALFYPSSEEELQNCYTKHDWDGSWRTPGKKNLGDRLYKKRRKLFEKLLGRRNNR
ncbi:glycosyltransferase family 32 protein [Endozoicomonas sp. 8E]|uniref:glycosyltransferase family 32 protein n=1 Tax=Endozoicomonas sp. 8E TaxID=3035692 RepID=UPI0029393F31|nr:glycosyltransferase [Endozoicomonas sp. 8E]WOG28443.1 TcdA/TcdB catalytic glycosyltransferase domain-containing protein [Endozoicomonas sp. 8E]